MMIPGTTLQITLFQPTDGVPDTVSMRLELFRRDGSPFPLHDLRVAGYTLDSSVNNGTSLYVMLAIGDPVIAMWRCPVRPNVFAEDQVALGFMCFLGFLVTWGYDRQIVAMRDAVVRGLVDGAVEGVIDAAREAGDLPDDDKPVLH